MKIKSTLTFSIRIVLWAIWISLASHQALAATFFPEYDSAPKKAITQLRNQYEIQIVRGVESIVIDDMVFPISEVSTRGFTGDKWINGVFVYQFDTQLTAYQRSQFEAACDWWENTTPITCKEQSNESVFYTIHTGNSNQSGVGMKNSFMIIYNWSTLGIIAHEIGHALGSRHEQNRPDRYNYVFVNEQNIVKGMAHNFELHAGAVIFTTYDYDSIMHYGSCAFSINPNCRNESNQNLAKKTLVPVACDQSIEGRFGQRQTLSPLDILGMSQRYGANVSSLFNFARNTACGTEVISKAQMQKICDDGSENCAAQANGHRAIEEHSFSDCDDSFFPPLGNCRTGKEQTYYHHREGSRCGILQTNHIQHHKWSCGCPIFLINAACSTNENGISKDAVTRYSISNDPTERALGKFTETVQRNISKGRLESSVEEKLSELLLMHSNQENYYKIINRARRRMNCSIFFRRVFLRPPISEAKLFEIMKKSQ